MNKSKAIVVITIVSVLIVLGIVSAFVNLDNGELGIYKYISYPKLIKLGLDLKGGVYAVYEASADTDKGDIETRMNGTRDALETMLFNKGYTEAVVTLENDNRIRVEVPDVDDPRAIFDLIGRPATLEFTENDASKTGENGLPDRGQVYVSGKNLKNVYVTLDQNNNYAVALEFDDVGTRAFAKATSERINQNISIWVGDECVTTAKVNTAINDGNAIITGNYDYDSANALVTRIQAGAFDVALSMIDTNTISATLGDTSLNTSVIAGLVGLALIIVFMCVFYRLFGVAASMSLMIYGTAYILFLAIFPWVQLTLAGIAGVILSIGMAVDGNIVIFARIKDEFRLGNASYIGDDGMLKNKSMSIHAAVKNGYRKATPAIIDGNITTILGCIVMLFVGGSAIKSFAITLLIGVVISVLCSLLVSRVLVYSMIALAKDDPKLYSLSVGGADHE